MNCCCENCGWSEIVGSPIMCNYSGHRTWRDECCEAWKPKEEETNMVEVVRCKDCKAWKQYDDMNLGECELYPEYNKMGDWFCNFGERKEGR